MRKITWIIAAAIVYSVNTPDPCGDAAACFVVASTESVAARAVATHQESLKLEEPPHTPAPPCAGAYCIDEEKPRGK